MRRWEIKGDRVRYISAERNGAWEELPVSMVDWAATEKFAHGLTEQGREETAASDDARAVDAEEAAEKAEMTSRTPPVAPRLNLPDRDGVWVLDYFRNQPELVTLEQDSGNINQRTGHNVQRAPINPVPKKAEVRLDGAGSKVHLHENEPAFYVSLTGGDDTAGADAMSVATQRCEGDGSGELAEEPVRHRGSGPAARLSRDHECDARPGGTPERERNRDDDDGDARRALDEGGAEAEADRGSVCADGVAQSARGQSFRCGTSRWIRSLGTI